MPVQHLEAAPRPVIQSIQEWRVMGGEEGQHPAVLGVRDGDNFIYFDTIPGALDTFDPEQTAAQRREALAGPLGKLANLDITQEPAAGSTGVPRLWVIYQRGKSLKAARLREVALGSDGAPESISVIDKDDRIVRVPEGFPVKIVVEHPHDYQADARHSLQRKTHH